jgi:regulator of cell morphogenesis and NO signaling
MNDDLFDWKSKLTDMTTVNPNIVLMLPRFGLSLGFGDRSVNDVCGRQGVDTDFFLLICNVYSFDDYIPSQDKIISTDMKQLVPYLEKSHNYYFEKRLPHIERHIERIASNLEEKTSRVFKVFFADYKNEVIEHFNYEEKYVYPHIERLLNGVNDNDYRISTYLSAHSNVDEKLDDLRQIISKYLPETASSDDAIDVIYDILQLSHDLKKHSLIEEKILVPYVKHLEKKVK